VVRGQSAGRSCKDGAGWYGDSQLSGAARTELGGTGTVSWAELGRAAWGEMGGAGRSWAYRVYQFMNQVSIFGVGLWSFATWLQ